MKVLNLCGAILCLFFVHSAAVAAFDLQITEIWPGNEPGENLSEDWFELTNFGDMAFDSSVDGALYFDDDSADWEAADQLFYNADGPVVIEPGESVVFSDGGLAGAVALFGLWSPELTFTIGQYDGSGLGQGGDGVAVFHDADMNGLDASDPVIDFETYPDANATGGRSFDVYNGVFSHPSYATLTTDLNDAFQSAIGTPGYLAAVPEPSSVIMVLLGASLGALALRRS